MRCLLDEKKRCWNDKQHNATFYRYYTKFSQTHLSCHFNFKLNWVLDPASAAPGFGRRKKTMTMTTNSKNITSVSTDELNWLHFDMANKYFWKFVKESLAGRTGDAGTVIQVQNALLIRSELHFIICASGLIKHKSKQFTWILRFWANIHPCSKNLHIQWLKSELHN